MSFFLDNLSDCRAAFLTLIGQAKTKFARATPDQVKIPGIGTIDTVFLAPKKKPSKKLVIISSGVHGVEGFAGSAIQRKFLSGLISGECPLLCDVLILHVINPFGFNEIRRVNENNVDLNRNFFLKKEKLPKKEKNRNYRKLVSFFKPRYKFTFYPLEFLLFAIRFFGILIRFGPRKFTDTVVNGQFEYRKGIYYGGKKPQPVVKELRSFLREEASHYKDILLIDLHTGYGEKNGICLIQNSPLDTREDMNIQRIADGLPLLRPNGHEDFYHTAGDFTDFLGKILPSKVNIFPLTLELGTSGNLNLWGALKSSFLVVAENRIYHHGSRFASSQKRVKEKFLRLFYPKSKRWRENALAGSYTLMRTLIDRFYYLGK